MKLDSPIPLIFSTSVALALLAVTPTILISVMRKRMRNFATEDTLASLEIDAGNRDAVVNRRALFGRLFRRSARLHGIERSTIRS